MAKLSLSISLTEIGFDFNIENDKRGSSGEIKPGSALEQLGKG
jgi:hypothetical protein